MQGLCNINKYCQYQLGSIFQSTHLLKKATCEVLKNFDTTLIKRLTIGNSIYKVIKTTSIINSMSNFGNM